MRQTLIGICCLAWLAPIHATEISGSPDELRSFLGPGTRVVTLEETAHETAYTDVAKIDLIVRTEDKTLAGALDENVAVRARVRRQLADAGIAPEDISSAKYSASPQYGWFGRKPSTFDVVNELTVAVDDERLFQRVAEIADSDDLVSFGGVEFEHSESDAYEATVRDKALEAVLENARYFAERLGLEARPVAFAFSDASVDRGRGFVLEEIVVTGSRRGGQSLSGPSTPAPPPSFDEVEYRVTVQVTFELVPADDDS